MRLRHGADMMSVCVFAFCFCLVLPPKKNKKTSPEEAKVIDWYLKPGL